MAFRRIATGVALASTVAFGTAGAAGLKGSPASMRAQHSVAVGHDFTFLRTPAQVRAFVEAGRLVSVEGNDDYRVSNVSFPYARPEVLAFIERLGRRYHEANGAPLVVTSLTRPTSTQPRNAHRLSVHPTGMAVDLRIPADSDARVWLETELLELEAADVLDVTREKNPPHYHVAVFPEKFTAYAAANPLPPKAEPAQPAATTIAEANPTADTTAGVHEADAGSGLGAWGITALAGLVAAGGAAARRRRLVTPRSDA